MTWTAILDFLAALGSATAASFWAPVLAWTVFALPAYGALRLWDLSPHVQYRGRQALLVSLPLGLLVGIVVPPISSLGLLSPDAPVSLALSAPTTPSTPAEVPSSLSTSPSWSWLHALGLFTLAACTVASIRLIQLGGHALALGRFRRQGAVRQRASVQRLTDRLADRLDLRRPVRTVVITRDLVPQTFGVFRPTIVLPESMIEDEKALRMALTHELVHIQRYDCAAQWIEHLIAAVFVIHPGVGLLRHSIAHFREQSCDAAVLGADTFGRQAYATLLYRLGAPSRHRDALALSTHDTPSTLQDRIRAMQDYPSPATAPSLVSRTALGALVLGLVLGIAACSDFAGEAPGESTATSAEARATSDALLSGRILDARTGEPLAGTNVVAEPHETDETGRQPGTSTRKDGTFQFRELSPGSYTVTFSYVGYQRETRQITLAAGQPQSLNIKLQTENATLPTVEVHAYPPE